jgi:hypothetical protein
MGQALGWLLLVEANSETAWLVWQVGKQEAFLDPDQPGF